MDKYRGPALMAELSNALQLTALSLSLPPEIVSNACGACEKVATD